jgi:hypothetical protein
MRENQFLGILALMLALGMPLPFELFACVVLIAEGKIFDAEIRTETEFVSALQDSRVFQITLKNDIVTTRNLEISRHLILDLGGFNITSLKENICVLDIKHGSVLITGKGSIVAYGLKGTAICVKGATTSDNENYAEVLIDENIKLFAPNYYGLLVAPNFKAAYGATIDFRGTMVAQDGFCINGGIRGRGKNIPLIKIADQTRITVDENAGVAIHAAGYGRWEIGASEITGATGIVAQSGNLTLNGTKIIATGEYVEADSADDSLTMIGAVLQSGKAINPDHSVEVTVNGGEYTSLRSYLFAETRQKKSKPALQMLIIEGGEFAGKLGTFYGLAPRNTEHAVTVVYGGDFTENVQDYISSSCHIDKVRGQGIYHVIEDKVAEEIDEATRLARAEGQLQALIEESAVYTNGYVSGDLGKWKPVATKAIASIKRAITLGKKALKQHLEYERIVSAEQSLQRALDNLELVNDAMRAELAESIASVDAIDPGDYTKYSYQQLTTVAAAADELLQRESASLKDLYSAILDVEINIDLLDGIDEVSAEELDEMFEAPAPTPPSVLPPKPQESILSPEMFETEPIPEVVEAPIVQEPAVQELQTSLESELSSDEIIDISEFLASLFLTQSAAFFTPVQSAAPPESEPRASIGAAPEAQPFVENPVEVTPVEPVITPETDPAYILSHSVDYPAEAALLEAKGNLYSMLEAVQDLTLGDYETDFAEQFGELQVAIVKARSILYRPNANFVELMSAMDDLAEKTTGLKGMTEVASTEDVPTEAIASAETQLAPSALEQAVQVDWTGLSEVVAEISRLNPDDFTATSYARVLSQLEVAKSLLGNSDATQSTVEDLVFEINLALLALEHAPQAQNLTTANPAPAAGAESAVYTPSPAVEQDPTVTPNWIMSMLAGAYAGMATYRRSRLIAKQQKHSAL